MGNPKLLLLLLMLLALDLGAASLSNELSLFLLADEMISLNNSPMEMDPSLSVETRRALRGPCRFGLYSGIMVVTVVVDGAPGGREEESDDDTTLAGAPVSVAPEGRSSNRNPPCQLLINGSIPWCFVFIL